MSKRKRQTGDGPAELWERQPGESSAQYAKFCAYRDMRYIPQADGSVKPDLRARRSLRELAKSAGCRRQTLEEISAKNRWVKRAEAYDSEIEQQIREKNEAEILKMRERHAMLATQMLKKATIRLVALQNDELAPADLIRMIDTGVKIERLSRGEATENQQISGEITARQKNELDLSTLSKDELRRLAALGGGADDPAGNS